MLSDITIGEYYPGESLVHRLDPRIKIALLFVLMIAIFFFHSLPSYIALCTLTILVILISQIPLRMVLKSLRPLFWLIAITFVLHLFSTPGESLMKVWIFDLTKEGIWQGLFISVRLILLIVLASMLTYTTSPLKLTDALESILSPCRRIGVPSHELAMMMTIALRFVPTLIEETDRIMKAQRSRGADFSTGSIMHRVRAVIPILVPLFLSAFRRADDLALAMEARCYHGGEGRTQMHVLKYHMLDFAAAAFVVIFLALLLVFCR